MYRETEEIIEQDRSEIGGVIGNHFILLRQIIRSLEFMSNEVHSILLDTLKNLALGCKNTTCPHTLHDSIIIILNENTKMRSKDL